MRVCFCVWVHADFSAVLSPLGEFEVSLELAYQGDALFWVSYNFTNLFMQFQAIFMHFHAILAFQPFWNHFQHIWYQHACTQAAKFNGDVFTHVHAFPHAISHDLHAINTIFAISAIFRPISTCWVSKGMYSSWEIQWWYFYSLSRTPSCNFTQFSQNVYTISHNSGFFQVSSSINIVQIAKHGPTMAKT